MDGRSGAQPTFENIQVFSVGEGDVTKAKVNFNATLGAGRRTMKPPPETVHMKDMTTVTELDGTRLVYRGNQAFQTYCTDEFLAAQWDLGYSARVLVPSGCIGSQGVAEVNKQGMYVYASTVLDNQ